MRPTLDFDDDVLQAARELTERLAQFCSTKHHVFWADVGRCLATFDRTIPLAAVAGASRSSLAIVSAT